MDKELMLKLKLAMNDLEKAVENLDLVVEACCEDPSQGPHQTKGSPMMSMRNKFLSIDTGSASNEE